MGKQTAVAMTDDDEKAFLAFLCEYGEIRILAAFAPNPEVFEVDAFAPREEGNWQYFLWNTDFQYDFSYGQVNADVTGKHKGWYYMQNTSAGPFIEYERHNFRDEQGLTYGRIYWAKCRTRTGEFCYDLEAFDKWYGRIARWIRARGRQRERGAYNVYYLPDAWEKYGDPKGGERPRACRK